MNTHAATANTFVGVLCKPREHALVSNAYRTTLFNKARLKTVAGHQNSNSKDGSLLLTVRISYRNLPLPRHHEAECEGSAPKGRQPGHKQSHAQLDSLCVQRRQYLLQGSDKLAHDEDFGEASSPQQSHSHHLLPTRGNRGCLLIGLDEARLVDMQCVCQLTRDKSTATPRS